MSNPNKRPAPAAAPGLQHNSVSHRTPDSQPIDFPVVVEQDDDNSPSNIEYHVNVEWLW